mmetsp:Transcript_70012/g.205294  ORF Transcript_70012/g.205294 Transcript_70012/m.205294 type:complete len:204 (+) Transcript_70012:68-679(+)
MATCFDGDLTDDDDDDFNWTDEHLAPSPFSPLSRRSGTPSPRPNQVPGLNLSGVIEQTTKALTVSDTRSAAVARVKKLPLDKPMLTAPIRSNMTRGHMGGRNQGMSMVVREWLCGVEEDKDLEMAVEPITKHPGFQSQSGPRSCVRSCDFDFSGLFAYEREDEKVEVAAESSSSVLRSGRGSGRLPVPPQDTLPNRSRPHAVR